MCTRMFTRETQPVTVTMRKLCHGCSVLLSENQLEPDDDANPRCSDHQSGPWGTRIGQSADTDQEVLFC